MHKPLSVILPVYNAERFIRASIESILNQTYDDFELIIINDGSTDGSLDIIREYKSQDERVKLISRENRGLVASLNEGIRLSNAKYIARQDADDISKPERLSKQISFLQKHRHHVIVGSSIEVMDESSKILHEHRVLINDPELRQELLIRSPFAHGSVMFRKSSVIKAGLYDQASWPAEDYALWLRLSFQGKLANIDEPMYIYREHSSSISTTQHETQLLQAEKVRSEAWKHVNQCVGARIQLTKYKKLPHANHRVERILNNVLSAHQKAVSKSQPLIGLKILNLISFSYIPYRRLTGKIKRRVTNK